MYLHNSFIAGRATSPRLSAPATGVVPGSKRPVTFLSEWQSWGRWLAPLLRGWEALNERWGHRLLSLAGGKIPQQGSFTWVRVWMWGVRPIWWALIIFCSMKCPWFAPIASNLVAPQFFDSFYFESNFYKQVLSLQTSKQGHCLSFWTVGLFVFLSLLKHPSFLLFHCVMIAFSPFQKDERVLLRTRWS